MENNNTKVLYHVFNFQINIALKEALNLRRENFNNCHSAYSSKYPMYSHVAMHE